MPWGDFFICRAYYKPVFTLLSTLRDVGRTAGYNVANRLFLSRHVPYKVILYAHHNKGALSDADCLQSANLPYSEADG